MLRSNRDRQRERLLRDFDETVELTRPVVARDFGEAGADALCRRAREKYEEILPQVPRIRGSRAGMLNAFLRVTAQEVAAYQAVKEHGGTAADAWEICQEAIRLKMERFPRWKRWLMQRFMFSRLVRELMRRRERKNELGRFGDFELRYRCGDGRDFDHGVDYLGCGNLELVKKLGAHEFAPYVCMSDIPLSDALGWGLIRTQTLADGCTHCDFRFKRGAATRISSKTPEVQRTIERIEQRSRSRD